MLVKKIMTKDIGGIVPESSLKEAAYKMNSLGVGFLPVCDGEKIVGVITDRDITVRSVAKGKIPDKSPVKEFMTTKIYWVFEADSVNKAASIMQKHKIRRLVVLNSQKILAGVISLGDIATYSRGQSACNTLREVSLPAQPRRGA